MAAVECAEYSAHGLFYYVLLGGPGFGLIFLGEKLGRLPNIGFGSDIWFDALAGNSVNLVFLTGLTLLGAHSRTWQIAAIALGLMIGWISGQAFGWYA